MRRKVLDVGELRDEEINKGEGNEET